MFSVDDILTLFKQESFSVEDTSVIETLLNENLKNKSIDEIKYKLKDFLQTLISEEEKDAENEAQKLQIEKLSVQKILSLPDQAAEDLLKLAPEDRRCCTLYKSLKDTTKSRLVYSILAPNQRVVFEQLHQCISSSFSDESAFDGEIITAPTSVCIDSPPGTGKSFIISALAATLVFSAQAIVFQRSLAAKLRDCDCLAVLTCCKYIMLITRNEEFLAVKDLFKDEATIKLMLIKIYKIILHFHRREKLLILDEYTVVSPWFLVVLIVAGAVRKFNFLCTGDKDQHSAIDGTRYHRQTNYTVIEHLVDHKLKLNTQMRITDRAYSLFINEFRERMHLVSTLDNVPNTFAHLYYLFGKFRQKFFVKQQLLNVVYMSAYHRKLKERQLNIINYLNEKNEPYTLEPFKQGQSLNELIDLHIPLEHKKFLPCLLLVVGQKYIWSAESHKRYVVTLLRVDNDSLLVECESKEVVIQRTKLTKYVHNIPDEHFDWLKKWTECCIWQYPLVFYCITYYAAQGLTFNNEIIELDLDADFANSLYVGLSRVTRDSQVYALRTKYLLSLVYTAYKNDEFYYKLGNVSRELHSNLLSFAQTNESFKDESEFRVCTKDEFERSWSKYLKVPRSEYVDSGERARTVTELLSVAKFLMEEKDELFKGKGVCDETLVGMYERFVIRKELKIETSSSSGAEKRTRFPMNRSQKKIKLS